MVARVGNDVLRDHQLDLGTEAVASKAMRAVPEVRL